MNHQAKVVSNDSIVVYFSLHELSQNTGIPIKELKRAIGNITGPFSGLAYVSVIPRTTAKKRDRDEDYFPLLNEAKFTVNTGLFKRDISGTIISCKITLLNTNTPHDHLLSYQTGLVKGEYSFVPRLTSNGRYLYPQSHNQYVPEEEREGIPSGSVSIIGFDLLFNDDSRVDEPTPSGIREQLGKMFPGISEEISEDHFRRHAPSYSVQPLYPAEVPDPHFTPTTVNSFQEDLPRQSKLMFDLQTPDDMDKIKRIFEQLNYPIKNTDDIVAWINAQIKEYTGALHPKDKLLIIMDRAFPADFSDFERFAVIDAIFTEYDQRSK